MVLIKNIDLQLLKVVKREGISKKGNAYLFFDGRFLDQEGDVINLKINNKIAENTTQVAKLLSVKNVECNVDLALYPSGFNLKGTVVKIDL
jgi:hypothetical protein